MKKAGIFLLITGLGFTVVTAISFFTKDKVVDSGSVEITSEKPQVLNWSPLVGITALVIGGVMFLLPSAKPRIV